MCDLQQPALIQIWALSSFNPTAQMGGKDEES